eukprot:3027856-Heterocapsa_arctica.AAC.1
MATTLTTTTRSSRHCEEDKMRLLREMDLRCFFASVVKVSIDPCLGQGPDEPLEWNADDRMEAALVEGGELGAEMALASDLGGF